MQNYPLLVTNAHLSCSTDLLTQRSCCQQCFSFFFSLQLSEISLNDIAHNTISSALISASVFPHKQEIMDNY